MSCLQVSNSDRGEYSFITVSQICAPGIKTKANSHTKKVEMASRRATTVKNISSLVLCAYYY